MELEKEDFGQEQPPLYQLIRKILEEYPNGQIFKEIIQNADDARATEVKFYLDCRSLQSLPPCLVNSKIYDEPERFEGPALMSFNNALFKEEDWKGIQKLYDSGKAKNPHKVGKFGIGFNSVYHITDLPIIISGKFCGYLEPQEEIWKGKRGKKYSLKDMSECWLQDLLPSDISHQFSVLSPSFVNSITLFRFPLRKKSSKLSDQICNIEKLQRLLQVLKVEAKYLLLFLRSVRSIKVIELTDQNNKTIFSCNASETEWQQPIYKQVESVFKGTYVQETHVIKKRFHLKIEIDDDGTINTSEWIVVHRVGSENLEVLALAEKQHVLPWVGTAFEVSKAHDNLGGRIFCFLPLPLEDRAPFSVHINGTFAVSTNRRSLCWESQERQDDQETMWNKCLVEKCIPDCYVHLLEEIIKLPSVDPKVVYNCWPVNSSIKGTPWEGILKPFFDMLLFSDRVVYTNSDCGQWISIADSLFAPRDNDIPSCIKSALTLSGRKVVELGFKQWDAIEEYYLPKNSVQIINPSIVRSILKLNQESYTKFRAQHEKYCILQYCLIDENYSDLEGLQLIPLIDGSFSTFQTIQNSKSQTLYVCRREICHQLLPGLDHIMVDLSEYDESIHDSLMNVASSGATQLKLLNEYHVAELVTQCNSHKWDEDRLEKFWEWLNNYELSIFLNIRLIPVKNAKTPVTVQSLSKDSSLVFVSRHKTLSKILRLTLEEYGIKFACESDFPYLRHPQLESCLYQLEPGDILDGMDLSKISNIQLSAEQSLAIQTFLSEPINNFESPSRINKVCEMQLFSILQNDSLYSINQLKTSTCSKALVQGEGFYFRTDLLPNQPMIFKDGQKLLTHFFSERLKHIFDHVIVINGVECLEKVVFPSIRGWHMIESKISEIMISVLDNLKMLTQKFPQSKDSLTENLSSLPFVTAKCGQCEPASLFDPDCKLLTDLYKGKPVFPIGQFADYTNELRLCYLRSPSSVTATDIYKIICDIQHNISMNQSLVHCDENTYHRSISVLKFLTEYPDLLDKEVHVGDNSWSSSKKILKDEISEHSKTYALLPVLIVQPPNYPPNLNWKGSEHSKSLAIFNSRNVIVLSGEISNYNHPYSWPDPMIVGSEAVFIENVPLAICEQLTSSNDELADAIVAHFKHVLEHKKDMEVDTLRRIAYLTYEFLCSCISVNAIKLNSIEEWVWVESCSMFLRPDICALSTNSSYKNSLKPFVHVLEEMKKYKRLFCHFGVYESVTNEQIISVLQKIKDKTVKISNRTIEITSSDAWSMVKSVLEWVIGNECSFEDILIPIECNSSFPELHPADEVFYTDNEMLLEIAPLTNKDYKLVHHNISHLAPQLRLTPLSDHLDITEEVFGDAGQHEPLTTSLKSILKEYKDGLTIIKEMIQNADDAEATEVNVLYDDRSHTKEELLFKGMADSHGPALIIHNNAKFTEEDFVNITKLEGATKEDKQLKIGKFGVGFCSVYHITDVPSFVSNEWLYIFDPTLKHLKGVVKNVNQPGKRVRYLKDFLSRTQQLAPYRDLFGFDPSHSYNGTMFRLPFRNYPSEISSTIYNESSINDLQNELRKNGDSLLMFLNHVKKITFWSIKREDVAPMQEISIEKTVNKNHVKIGTFVRQRQTDVNYWMISCHREHISCNSIKQLGISSVACKVRYESGSYEVVPAEGSVFCFLPLSILTGLPVHINANFEVMRNRRGIWTKNSSENLSDSKELWNQKLMEVTIPKAYCKLLLTLKEMHIKQLLKNYEFFSLWPLVSNPKAKDPWSNIFRFLYQKVLHEALLYSIFVSDWKKMKEIRFLEKSILVLSNMFENEKALECILEAISILKLQIIHLPADYVIEIQTHVTDVPFMHLNDFMDVFLDKLKEFRNHIKIRNKILYYALQMLNSKNIALHNKLKCIPCVPCTPDGEILKCCCDVVDPDTRIAKLFVEEDSVFPISEFTNNKCVKEAMIMLGMLNHTLPWNMLVSSTEKIEQNYSMNEGHALDQIRTIIKCVGINIKRKGVIENDKNTLDLLRQTKFLPVLQRPENFPFDWKGDGHKLCSPLECIYMNSSQLPFLVGTQQMILSNKCKIDDEVLKCLCIQQKPSIKDVISHYECIVQSHSTLTENNALIQEIIDKICQSVYRFLENEIKYECCFNERDIMSTSTGKIVFEFNSKRFVWSGREFVRPVDTAENWTKPGPYLFKIPGTLAPCKFLIRSLHIPESFSAPKLFDTLEKMFNDFGKQAILENCRPVVESILTHLNSFTKQDFQESKDNIIYLPSSEYTLHPVEDMSFNDTQWVKPDDSEKYVFVHDNLKRNTALKLGIKPYRTRFLDNFSGLDVFEGVPFGQREKLTLRIRNIIQDCPLDATVLKELLQNADDAKATKMYIILDKREHGKKRVPSEKWEELQGPALLVWNNKDFTDDDLRGIQSLGLGSKRHDSESIGQFGIGFNIVYHITDCPSFITRGDTLCVFDPHCRYVPGANELKPGRCFQNIGKKIWKKFPDLCSPFLQNYSLPNQPEGLGTGSLFRFPLRCTKEQVHTSELIEDKVENNIITAEKMERYLDAWIDDIKDALLFLNHVISFKVFIIDNKTCKFHMKASYDVETDRTDYHHKLVYHKTSQCVPFVVPYLLTLNTHTENGRQSSNRWLIQQGFGDIDYPEQNWPYTEKVLPKHGIAALLGSSDSLNGKIFCFLPLPGNSGLPVHINGQFILNSNRQTIWSGNEFDKRVEWNNKMKKAICSSYVRFIIEARNHYIRTDGYPQQVSLQNDCEKYYSLFPYWLEENRQTNSEKVTNHEWKELSKQFFMKLLGHNHKILICQQIQHDKFFAEWHVLKNANEPFQQNYFCPPFLKKNILPLLERIQMKCTLAPTYLDEHFMKFETYESLMVSPSSVFTFYCKFQSKIFEAEIPCYIQDSPFQTVKVLKSFLQYITKDKSKTKYREFIKPPYDHALLLTADNILRPFKKVLHSRYHHLFQRSASMFLHEACFDLEMDLEYFLPPKSAGFSKVQQLINENFSAHLMKQEVENTIISKKDLEIFWECIQNDRLFKYYEQQIIENWALIPADNGYLYSSGSPIKPIIPDFPKWSNVLKIFRHLKVPIFSGEVQLAEKYCLKLSSDFDKILLVVCEILRRDNVSEHMLDCEKSSDLLSYFSRCSFRHDESILSQILFLPVFMTVTGKLTTLQGKKVYLWPCDSFCKAGYNIWAPKDKVVFLEKGGSWTNLCQSDFSRLGKCISAQDVYIQLIFKVFHLLSPEERKDHLKYIRDFVYPDAVYTSGSAWKNENKRAAINFINELLELKCFEPEADLNKLLPISCFSDNTIEIFTTFSDSFLFLSEEFKDEAWMEFFRQLNLRTKVTFDEYLQFCRKVAAGEHKDLRKASKVLVDYLFSWSAEPWYSKEHLDQIKDICFIATNDLKKLSSIKAPNQTKSFFPRLGLHLTSFDGAATEECASLVWTVKPVVSLPETAKSEKILRKLGVTTLPSVSASEIYQNIWNISNTKFANFDLFHTYNIQYGEVNLVEIMVENISRLYEIHTEESLHYLKELKEIKCIPVFAVAGEKNPVLMNSFQVIKSPSDASLWPYVCTTPNSLNKIGDALDLIGVEQTVSLRNIQYVLKFAFNRFAEQPILPNEAQIFRACVLKLADLLLQSSIKEHEADAAKTLTPLYLPSIQSNSLLPISSLLFIDCNRYKRYSKSLDLNGTGYSLFCIPKLSSDDADRVTEKDICLHLPKEVRPKGLSFVCVESVVLVNEVTLTECPLYNHFLALKQLSSCVGDVLEKILTKTSPKSKEYITEFIKCLKTLLLEMKLLQCSNLEAVVSINRKEICCIKESYVLLDSTPCILYIDSQASSSGFVVWKDISHSFCLQIAKHFGKKLSSFLSFRKQLSSCLKCRTIEDLKEILEENEILNHELEMDAHASKTIELGAQISEDLHSYLVNDFNNILHTQEWVGYEAHDGYYVWAMILYPIVNENNKEDPLLQQYKIIINKGDEEGFDVSMLDLYKLIYRKDKSSSIEQSLVLTEDVSMASDIRKIADCQKLKTLKQQICDELQRIWKLPEKEKRKALRRLCYKYHPDKVVNTEEIHLYEEAFKFLQNQIDRLEANQELEDPNDVSNGSDFQKFCPSRWRMYYTDLEKNIQTMKKKEKNKHEEVFQAEESTIQVPQLQCDIDEAKRWLRQAECDYEALLVLQSAVTKGKRISCQALFMAHEVMEKGLKAAMYALVGLSQYFLTKHKLIPLANAIHSEIPTAALLVKLASKMEPYYLETRFPNQCLYPQQSPVDIYLPEESKDIADQTTEALKIIRKIVNNQTTL